MIIVRWTSSLIHALQSEQWYQVVTHTAIKGRCLSRHRRKDDNWSFRKNYDPCVSPEGTVCSKQKCWITVTEVCLISMVVTFAVAQFVQQQTHKETGLTFSNNKRLQTKTLCHSTRVCEWIQHAMSQRTSRGYAKVKTSFSRSCDWNRTTRNIFTNLSSLKRWYGLSFEWWPKIFKPYLLLPRNRESNRFRKQR